MMRKDGADSPTCVAEHPANGGHSTQALHADQSDSEGESFVDAVEELELGDNSLGSETQDTPSSTLGFADPAPSSTLGSADPAPSSTLGSADLARSSTLGFADPAPSSTFGSADPALSSTFGSADPTEPCVDSDRLDVNGILPDSDLGAAVTSQTTNDDRSSSSSGSVADENSQGAADDDKEQEINDQMAEACDESSPDDDVDKEDETVIDEDVLREREALMSEEEKETRRLDAQALKASGNDLFKSGSYERALEAYTDALMTCPLCHAKERSIMYSNRGATKMKLEKKESAIKDCSKALELNPMYMKALLRRADLYEQTDKLDEALADYQKALEMDPSLYAVRAACMRLPGQINERNEKMKTEMMGKLKDLGNLVLRPFGLSTENFNLQQDPNTGSYSVQFNQKPA